MRCILYADAHICVHFKPNFATFMEERISKRSVFNDRINQAVGPEFIEKLRYSDVIC